MASIGQLSPDGSQYWDGQRWAPVLSADGQWAWDGAQWKRIAMPAAPGQQLATRPAYSAAAPPPQPTFQYANPIVMYKAPTNSAAVASLVFGIVSWFLCPLVGGILAVVFGHTAQGQIRRSGESGAGMATAGLVLGYIHIAAAAIFVIFWLLILGGLTAILGAIATSSR